MPCSSPKLLPSSKGLAYLASATFISRLFLFSDKLLNSFFTYELIHIYSAHLETGVLLFFQGVFQVPLSILGFLVFFGLERRSFVLVLSATLMIFFLILLRYGAEAALLFIHWEEHSIDRGPSLLLYFILDVISVFILLFHVYLDLAVPDPAKDGISPSRLNSLRRRLSRHRQRTLDLQDLDQVSVDVEDRRRFNINGGVQTKQNSPPRIVGEMRKRKPPAPPPEDEGPFSPEQVEEITIEPPPRPPPSPKFKYRLRRNISSLKGEDEILEMSLLDEERKRNSASSSSPSPLPPNFVVREVELKEEDSDLFAPSTSSPLKEKSQSLKLYEEEPKRLELKLEETDLDLERDHHDQERQDETVEEIDYWGCDKKEEDVEVLDEAESKPTKEEERETAEFQQESEQLEDTKELEPVESPEEPEPEPEVEAEVTITIPKPKPRVKSKESFRQTAV